MFGKNKKLIERISQLEKELETEKMERAKAEASLEEFRAQKAMNVKAFEVIRSAMESKLSDLDNRAADFESFKTDEIKKFEEEKQQARESMKRQEFLDRELLRQELAHNKNDQINDLEQRLKYFNESMNRYLSMVQDIVGVLTTASFRAGKDIFSDNAETLPDCFKRELETIRPYSLKSQVQTGMPTIKDAQTYKLFELYMRARTDEHTQRNDT